MKLHAGSLYKNYLVLYGDLGILPGTTIIQVDDKDLQWDMYCNDLDVDFISSDVVLVKFKDKDYKLKYIMSEDPIKDL